MEILNFKVAVIFVILTIVAILCVLFLQKSSPNPTKKEIFVDVLEYEQGSTPPIFLPIINPPDPVVPPPTFPSLNPIFSESSFVGGNGSIGDQCPYEQANWEGSSFRVSWDPVTSLTTPHWFTISWSSQTNNNVNDSFQGFSILDNLLADAGTFGYGLVSGFHLIECDSPHDFELSLITAGVEIIANVDSAPAIVETSISPPFERAEWEVSWPAIPGATHYAVSSIAVNFQDLQNHIFGGDTPMYYHVGAILPATTTNYTFSIILALVNSGIVSMFGPAKVIAYDENNRYITDTFVAQVLND